MSHIFGRRVATVTATLAVAAGAFLAVGGTASAAPNPAADHAVTVSHSSSSYSSSTTYGNRVGDERGDRQRDRGGDERGDRQRDSRWDGHRDWHRSGDNWYCSDHGQRYRYDGYRFYNWNHGGWNVVTGNAHGFDHGLFR
ncbi:hypothetical protein [Streptomyces mirabilis]|uniref:hypothetical protein n=1 Tax=Streptomyces mirabilis TaxID=68239 RepID=UPI00365A9C95